MKNLVRIRSGKTAMVVGILMVGMFLMGNTRSWGGELTVMTRNLYLGADLVPVMSAKTPEEFVSSVQVALGTIGLNNFPERARVLAGEIAEKKPHLVALQEVYNFTFNGGNYPPQFCDYLGELTRALAERGASYRVAAVVKNMDLLLPFGGNALGVTDTDVILARNDLDTREVPFALAGCKESGQGCNYQVVARIPNPLDPRPEASIAVERGFVAVDAWSDEISPVRFVNTHLETRELGSGMLQAAQAAELVAFLSFPNPGNLPIIVAGDFNSSPVDDYSIPMGSYELTPPYRQLVDAGYIDTWTLRSGKTSGESCCQEEGLRNLDSLLYERIDLIFSNTNPAGKVKVNLTGSEETDKTPSGLWPSDHAGVVARLEF